MSENLDFIFDVPEAPQAAAASARAAEPGRLYDIAILGGGPAGLSAAVYTARKRLDCLMVSPDIGGQVLWTGEVENYIGFQYIQGRELIALFKKQVEKFPIAQAIGAPVTRLGETGGAFTVETVGGGSFRARAVIVATGKRYRRLEVPGEAGLIGKGVSFCATCDAPLFEGQTVAVIGGGNSALTAVNDLVRYARKIFVVNIAARIQADPILVEKARAFGRVEFLEEAEVAEIRGRERVEGIRVISRKTGVESDLAVTGVFVEIGLVPNTDFLDGFLALNKQGEVIVDCFCNTSRAGIFAAGDVTTVPEKQIIVAAGEGAKAALTAYKYLLNREG